MKKFKELPKKERLLTDIFFLFFKAKESGLLSEDLPSHFKCPSSYKPEVGKEEKRKGMKEKKGWDGQ